MAALKANTANAGVQALNRMRETREKVAMASIICNGREGMDTMKHPRVSRNGQGITKSHSTFQTKHATVPTAQPQ